MKLRWSFRAANDRAPQCESRILVPQPKKEKLEKASLFLSNPKDWYVITRSVYVIAVGVCHHRRCISFGLITYLSAKVLHTSLRDDYIPSATDYIQGLRLDFFYLKVLINQRLHQQKIVNS